MPREWPVRLTWLLTLRAKAVDECHFKLFEVCARGKSRRYFEGQPRVRNRANRAAGFCIIFQSPSSNFNAWIGIGIGRENNQKNNKKKEKKKKAMTIALCNARFGLKARFQ